MAQFFRIHPRNPQPRLIKEAAKIIKGGGITIYPTDAGYAIGCHLGDNSAATRIRVLRHLSEAHFFTLVCRDLSEISSYALVDDMAFRLLKTHTPGPYTFILKAGKEVPKRFLQPKRKTIGMRVPDNLIVRALLAELGEPLMSVSLISSSEAIYFSRVDEIIETYGRQVELVIEGEVDGTEPTTIVDLTLGSIEVTRVGKGDPRVFL